jgi:hypothetical protein
MRILNSITNPFHIMSEKWQAFVKSDRMKKITETAHAALRTLVKTAVTYMSYYIFSDIVTSFVILTGIIWPEEVGKITDRIGDTVWGKGNFQKNWKRRVSTVVALFAGVYSYPVLISVLGMWASASLGAQIGMTNPPKNPRNIGGESAQTPQEPVTD